MKTQYLIAFYYNTQQLAPRHLVVQHKTEKYITVK